MKCSSIGSQIFQNRQFSAKNFKGINDIDYSKTHYDRIGSGQDYLTREIQYNSNNAVLSHIYKYYENGRMVERDFYSCKYHNNGRISMESTIKQKFAEKTEYRSRYEYDNNGKVTKFQEWTTSL